MKILNTVLLVMLSTVIGCAGLNRNALPQKNAACNAWSNSVMKDWVGYDRLECIWKSLQKEDVQKIGFCEWGYIDPNKGLSLNCEPDKLSPEEWMCDDIVEPAKIKEVMQLLGKALRESNGRFTNEHEVTYAKCGFWWMRIVTDRHKVIIRVACWEGGKPIRGIGWTSLELKERLKQWNPGLYP